MTRLRRAPILKDRLRGDDGIALATVVGMSVVLMLLVTSALTFSVSTMTKAKSDEESNAAMSAAYAGISDYQARLTNDNTYQKYGDPVAPFSRATGSTTLSLPTGALTNKAFGYGVAGTWAAVPGAAGNADFRYEVDNSKYAEKGIIRLRSTGRVGTETRSIVADIRQKGFLDYLYFTDYETRDPAITGFSEADCKLRFPARDDDKCGGAIQFGAGEVMNGPTRSNDALYVCAGATFNGAVQSNYNVAPFYRKCGEATFNLGLPAYADQMSMPATNQTMLYEMRGDLTSGDVPRPGCLYTGPTLITFLGDGYMTVRSPWTRSVNLTATGGMANVACGTPGSAANNLGSATGQRVKVPEQNLIYVQEVSPIDGNPNYWAPNTAPSGVTCTSTSNGLGFPLATTVNGADGKQRITTENILTSAAGSYYGCRAGDAFVNGSVPKAVNGQVTIASGHYVWVTGDLKYTDPAVDVLGLVGENAVWVWNPYGTVQTCTGTCTATNKGTTTTGSLLADSGREINAAILSVNHTFQVQNYNQGASRGPLTVMGAIAQKFRGTVGQPPIGYTKNYKYDVRFRSIAPPKFLEAASTTYGISKFAEVPAAYSANGAAR